MEPATWNAVDLDLTGEDLDQGKVVLKKSDYI